MRPAAVQDERAIGQVVQRRIVQPGTGRGVPTFAVQRGVDRIRAAVIGMQLAPQPAETEVVLAPAERAGAVAGGHSRRFIEKEQLSEPARLQQWSAQPAAELEPAGDPAAAGVVLADAPVTIVQAAAVAIDEAAGRFGDQRSQRRDAVLQRPGRHRVRVYPAAAISIRRVVRQLREDDAEAVVELYRVAFGATRPIDVDEIVSWLHNPELRPEWLRVLEIDGHVVGYGDIWIQGDEVALEVAAPGHWLTFVEWAERHAREQGLRQVRLFFPAGHELAGILAQRGYRHWRSAYTMRIEFDADRPPSPAPPAGIELRPYRPNEEVPVREALNECFADDPFHHVATESSFREFYLHKPGFDPTLWTLAWDGGELAGIVLAYPYAPGEPDVGWVSVLGVRAPWRRRGLGEALLRAAFRGLHDHGLRRAGLGVGAENETGAVRLYERAGMRVLLKSDNWMRSVGG